MSITGQSTLSSRYSVKPSNPGYDAHVLAHIKSRIVVEPVKGCWLWQGPVAEVKWNERGFRTGGIRRGWSEEEARNTPPVRAGEMTARRTIGVRNRGSAA